MRHTFPMSELGKIGWNDLTVPDAGAVRDFYQHVTGWVPSPAGMGDYEDYCMTPSGAEQPVAGICHARGHNADLPPKDMGSQGRYSITEDPAGAVTGLFERR